MINCLRFEGGNDVISVKTVNKLLSFVHIEIKFIIKSFEFIIELIEFLTAIKQSPKSRSNVRY